MNERMDDGEIHTDAWQSTTGRRALVRARGRASRPPPAPRSPRRGGPRWAATAALVLLGGGTAVALLAGGGSGERRAAGAARAPGPRGPVTVTWVGDMTFATGGRGHVRALLARVAPVLRRGGLVLGNLEGTLGTAGESKCPRGNGNACFAFRAPASYGRDLRRAGFDLVNVANNHAFDFGIEGLLATHAALRRARLRWTGLPGQVRVFDVGGDRVAVIGFAAYPWAADIRDVVGAQTLIRRAAARANHVIVVMHAGAEGAAQTHTPAGPEYAFGEDRGDTRGFAHAAVDAGADLVLGSGPHVLRGMERYRGRLIAYSLGNFVGDDNLATGGALSESAVLRIRLRRDGKVAGGRLLPLVLTRRGPPKPDRTGAAIATVRRLSREDFGRRGLRFGRRGRF